MVLAALMWSSAGVVTRQLHSAQGFEVTFWRSFFTVLALLVILPLWQGAGVFRRFPWRRGAFSLAGLCWATMFTAFMVALTMTGVARVLVTMAVAPLLTALLSRMVTGHRLPTRTWGAIAVAGAGMAWMFAGQLGGQSSSGREWLGSVIALGVPLAAAVHWTIAQRSQAEGDPLDLVRQTAGQYHQYPDGFMLFLGTMFSPVKDRGAQGGGFTHHLGDRVTIASAALGALVNEVQRCDAIAPWTFGVRALYQNLARRGLL